MKATSPAVHERSFLRNVVPFRIKGAGPRATLLRHCFLSQERLIYRVLGALEQVPLPALPRMLLAEGIQRMLEGQSPQRELRDVFEEAELECRKVLLGFNFSADGRRHRHEGNGSDGSAASAANDVYRAVQHDPVRRLLAYELQAACGHYARQLAVSSTPDIGSSVFLRTLIAADIRTDPFFVHLMLRFQSHPRDVRSGEPLEELPLALAEFVKECLLLERDAFGVFRFDPRGDNRHVLHCLKLSDITKTPTDFAMMLDPVMRAHGNYNITSTEVHPGRWMQHRVSCGAEEHRVDLDLPQFEHVTTDDEVTGGQLQFFAHYDEPLCAVRHKTSTKEAKGDYGHTERFELAIDQTNRTWLERFFLDR